MIPKEKLVEILKNRGVNLGKLVTDPKVYDKACNVAYKSIPIPWRWVVGKRRVSRMVSTLRDRVG